MMDYEELFTDYERMRYERAWDGFSTGNYSRIYEYISHRLGVTDADWFSVQSKAVKKLYCAKLVIRFHPEEEKRKKAQKYYDRHKGE